MRQAKIVCTLGPSSSSYEEIVALIRAGMNVARLNFSHGSHKEHKERIQNLMRAREDLRVPLAIMLDTRGPEIRVGTMEEGAAFFADGSIAYLVKERKASNEIDLHPSEIFEGLTQGMRVLFDDGQMSAIIDSIQGGNRAKIIFEKGGELRSRKGVNIPGLETGLPLVTDNDREDILFGVKEGVDLIAASFVCDVEQLLEIRKLTHQAGHPEIPIIAKIENERGIERFLSILEVADGIMVARGDLGVETPLERIPILQRMMVEKAQAAGKPVIIATQMLESMIHAPRPTRAEVSDVANAAYEMANALMLSAETAAGLYPVKAVETMAKIITETEHSIDHASRFEELARPSSDLSRSVAVATVKLTMTSFAFKALIACTRSGTTARMLSSLRPHLPIFAPTESPRSYHQMAFYWGVIPVLSQAKNADEAINDVTLAGIKSGLLQEGNLVVACYGVPWGVSGTTNSIRSVYIGGKWLATTPFVRVPGYLYGKLGFAKAQEVSKGVFAGKIVVLESAFGFDLELLRDTLAILYAPAKSDPEGEEALCRFAATFNHPLFLRADGVGALFHEQQFVSLDRESGKLYSGFRESL